MPNGTLAVSPIPTKTTHLGERYELKSQAGTGGMGTVFQAYDRQTRQTVAIKVLHGKGESDAARFEREAALLAELKHSAIVRFIDHGTTSHGEPFYVMEWLEGETLDERLARGRLSPSLAARMASRVLEALATAHNLGVIHRDIKPSNIFLSGFRVSDAKLIDFGVARRTDDAFRLTKRGNTVGTPMYNAPEQARGMGDLDGRVDIFALGCVMYEALTGEPAFAGDTAAQVMTRIASGQGPNIDLKLQQVDPELRRLLSSMLANRREDRPADALTLARRMAVIAERLAPLEGPSPLALPQIPQLRRLPRDVLSHNEERVMSVLLVARTQRPSGQTRDLPGHGVSEDFLAKLAATLEPFGGRIDRLLERSLIVTAPTLLSLTEQVEQIARMGLHLAAHHPDLRLSMATGRGVLLARLPAGEVVEQAAILLDKAAPGGVVTDDTSARLLSQRFAILHERAQHLLLRERDGLPAPRRILGEITRFCGRDRELAALDTALATSVSEDASGAAILVGSAGLGKTRLLAEWLRKLQGRPEDFLILQGRALPISSVAPYRALSGIFDQARLSFDGDVTAAAGAFVSWLEHACGTRPTVLVLEDAHLADTSSLQLLDRLLTQLAQSPLFVVISARPELDDRIPDLLEGHGPLRLRLPPLAQRHLEFALRGLLPAGQSTLDAWILERSRGNPYCLEELARHALVPSRTVVPDSVAGLVQSELALLGADAKRLLRAASVFGTTFSTAGLTALLGETTETPLGEMLAALAAGGLLHTGRENTDDNWQFCETVVREVCFGSLTASDRNLGRRLARAFLDAAGCPLPACLALGQSRVDLTPSELTAVSALMHP